MNGAPEVVDVQGVVLAADGQLARFMCFCLSVSVQPTVVGRRPRFARSRIVRPHSHSGFESG